MDKKLKIKEIMENDEKSSNFGGNVLDEAQKELDNIIQLLTLNKKSFDEELFKSNLNEYIKKYHRMLYSTVSTKIYGFYHNCENENIDNCIQNLTSLANKITIGQGMEEIDKIILKLLDHILLSNQQMTSLDVTEEKIDPFIKKSIEGIDKTIKRQESKVQKVKNQVKRDIDNQKDALMSQMISVVSIFVGIAFVMFGGMTLLNNLFDFSNMGYVPVNELLCLGSLIGIILIAITYSFMIFILKVTNKSMKAKSLLNGVLVMMMIVLLIICGITYCMWINNPSTNIYEDCKKDNQVIEQINIEQNQSNNNPKQENIKSK